MALLDCGHPQECMAVDKYDEDDSYCQWCEEVNALRERLATLKKAVEGQAIIVNGGTLTICIDGPLAYLELGGGSVEIRSNVTTTSPQPDVPASASARIHRPGSTGR